VELQILPSGQIIIKGRVLEYYSDALSHIVLVLPYIMACNYGVACSWRKNGGEHLYGRRLSCPVWSQKTKYLALLDAKSLTFPYF